MNDPRYESSNARKPFLRFDIIVKDNLSGGLDAD